MRKTRFFATCFLTMLSLTIASLMTTRPASAQTANATLNGTVKDQSGSLVPGATVTATNEATGLKQVATSDDGGRYTIGNLPPGAYDVQVEKSGFTRQLARGEDLPVSTTVTQDFTLRLSSVSETVEVSAETTEIEPTQTAVATVMATRDIDSLPILARNFSALAVLTPGVQVAGTGTGVSGTNVTIGNAAPYETGYVADGITNETGNQGNAYVQLAQDWIQEFSVMTLQATAEYGNAAGGVVNAVTRSGGNAIHGRAYGYYQNADLNSNPANYFSTKAPLKNERYGGMIGGPIQKNKLFYFAGYEGYHNATVTTRAATAVQGTFLNTAQSNATPINSLVPWLVDGTNTVEPISNDSKLAMLKLDYQQNDKNHFTARANLDLEYGYQAGWGGIGPYSGNHHSLSDPYEFTFGWTRIISPTTLSDFRMGYFQNGRGSANWYGTCNEYPGNAANPNPYNYISTSQIGGQTPWGNPDGYLTQVAYTSVGGNVTTGGGGVSPYCGGIQNNDGSGVIQDTVTFIRGPHEVKVGGYARISNQWSRDAGNNSAGVYTVNSAATQPFNPTIPIAQNFTAAGFKAAEVQGDPISYNVLFNGTPGLTSFSFHYYSWGGFAQDSWKIRHNLTLNIGLRYDFSTANSSLGKEAYPALEQAVPGSTGFIQPGFHAINNDALDIGPRAGFAWTPFKNQSTVVRGGYGIFYNANDGASADIYISSNSWATNNYILAANTQIGNPYCIGNTTCAAGIPASAELAVTEVLSAALANYTLPQFPLSNSACAATNSCTVSFGGHTYSIPALSVPFTPQGGRVDIAQNYRVPATAQATIGIEHQFGFGLTLSGDYVNHVGFNGIQPVNTNVCLNGPGATTLTTFCNPDYTTYYQEQSITSQHANDLQAKASFHDHRRDRIALAYQFGYAYDNSLSNNAISAHSTTSTNPFNVNYDYGPSSNDVRHALTVSGNIPLYWGVELSPLVSWNSALPYTATSSSQTPGTAAAPAGCLAYFTKCYPVLNGVTLYRNALRGADTFSLNARLSKTFRVRERYSLQLQFEAYNIPNYNNRGVNFFSNIDLANFKQPTNTSVPLRQLQLGARIDF